jgi:AAA family ATP:ADP antiporter
MQSSQEEFGFLRRLFWPIYGYELKKVLPLFLMLFFICFNYSALRSLKDTLVITGHSSGAEVLPFLKVWGILPGAILSTMLYTWLSRHFHREQLFYIITGGYLLFFALFGLVLYPYRDSLHPNQAAAWLGTILPAGFAGLIGMFENWTLSIFYIVAELWSTLVLGVLFWGFVNEVTRLSEAKRVYGILGLGSNLSAIAAGEVGIYLNQGAYNPALPFGATAWEQTLWLLLGAICISGIITMGLFWWTNKYVLTDPLYTPNPHDVKGGKKKKNPISFRESMNNLLSSRYVLCIAMLVLSYNLTLNLVEVIWKNEVKIVYPNPSEYNMFMNQINVALGVISACATFMIAPFIHRFGWTFVALLTPVIMLITGLGFFGLILMPHESYLWIEAVTGTSAVHVAVMFGAMQYSLSKGLKYSVFDASKEMVFIPLDPATRMKAKASIDGVVSRLGKSGGSILQQGLIVTLGSLGAITSSVALLTTIAVSGWIVATVHLGKLFKQKGHEHELAIQETALENAVAAEAALKQPEPVQIRIAE